MSKKNGKNPQSVVEAIAPTNDVASEELFDIKQAAWKLQLSQEYIRHAIRENDLKTELVPATPGSKTLKHVIRASELERWQASKATRSRREDGRNRFVLFATPDEKNELVEWMQERGIGAIIEKPKVYSKSKAEAEGDEVEGEDADLITASAAL